MKNPHVTWTPERPDPPADPFSFGGCRSRQHRQSDETLPTRSTQRAADRALARRQGRAGLGALTAGHPSLLGAAGAWRAGDRLQRRTDLRLPDHKARSGQPWPPRPFWRSASACAPLAPKARIAWSGLTPGSSTARARGRHHPPDGLWPQRSATSCYLDRPSTNEVDATSTQLGACRQRYPRLGLISGRTTNPDKLFLRSPAASLGAALSSLAGLLGSTCQRGHGDRRQRPLPLDACRLPLRPCWCPTWPKGWTWPVRDRATWLRAGRGRGAGAYLTPEGSSGDLWPSIER